MILRSRRSRHTGETSFARCFPMALHVLGEARRDARVLDAYLVAHPALCDRRRAQIAAISTPSSWPTCGPKCSIPSSIE